MTRFGPRIILYRWWRHWQFDIWLPRGYGYLCLGAKWRRRFRLVAYYSPNATPWHHGARGIGSATLRDPARCVCKSPDCTAPANPAEAQ